MNRFITFLLILIFIAGIAIAQNNTDKQWHQFRGPLGNGLAVYGDPPVTWSETENIRWKIEIPGSGLSTPIVWDNQIILLSAVESDAKVETEKQDTEGGRGRWMRKINPEKIMDFTVFSISIKDGSFIWSKVLHSQLPVEGTHGDGTWASNSPITDGEHIYAYFGSYGLYCLDMQGNLVWKKDLGDMRTRNSFGEGSSPALYEDKLIINWDHEGDSFIVVLDKKNGKEIWRKERGEPTSWSTPVVFPVKGKPQLIVSATNRILSYDLETGDEIWESTGLTLNVIPTPIRRNNVAYFMSGFRGSILQAIDLEKAMGNVIGTDAIVWEYNKDTPYTPSALVYDQYLYFMRINKEEVTCLNADTGEHYYGPEKMEGMKGVYASPVGVKDRIYIAGRNGVSYVLEKGPDYKVLSKNTLKDGIDASPVIMGNDLIIRGLKNLYCISADK